MNEYEEARQSLSELGRHLVTLIPGGDRLSILKDASKILSTLEIYDAPPPSQYYWGAQSAYIELYFRARDSRLHIARITVKSDSCWFTLAKTSRIQSTHRRAKDLSVICKLIAAFQKRDERILMRGIS
jgi:hypothetical protein